MIEYRLIYEQGSQIRTWGRYKTKDKAREGLFEDFKESVDTLYVNRIWIKKYNNGLLINSTRH